MFELLRLTYTTVPEYVRWVDEYPNLVIGAGDLKDAQRPWVLETVNRLVPQGERVLDLGGAKCELASVMMARHNVTVVDPYDGRGGGPSDAKPFRRRYPEITIVEGLLEPGSDLPKQRAVVSSSVVEHIPAGQHPDVVRAIYDVLEPGGYSIHAVDLTCRAVGGFLAAQQQELCRSWCAAHGLDVDIDDLVARMLGDVETFFLPVTGYQLWRANRPYEDYPWRNVGTMNLIARKTD